MMFELVFVGAWVWIIAYVARNDAGWPRWFVNGSVVKATASWFTFGAFLVGAEWMLVVGLGAVTFAVGPLWRLAIARLFWRPIDLGGVP